MTTTPDQSSAIPVEVRKTIDEWITSAYGQKHLGVPIFLIEKVRKSGQTIYRVELDVTLITTSPHRETVYMSVNSRSGVAPEVDKDSVVFFE
jgi:hypothetical protein